MAVPTGLEIYRASGYRSERPSFRGMRASLPVSSGPAHSPLAAMASIPVVGAVRQDGQSVVTSPLLATGHDPRASHAAAVAAAPATCSVPIGVLSVQNRSPLAWSPDGTMLAAVAGNGSIFILAFVGDKFVMRKLLTGHTQRVAALSWHPADGNVLVSAGVEVSAPRRVAVAAVAAAPAAAVGPTTHSQCPALPLASALLW